VSGIITSDTTWSAANSPYIVTGNILVQEGVTLTIEPGVMIKFEGEYYIRIIGNLSAEGTAASIITFTSNNENIVWERIEIKDSNNSVLRFCKIEQAVVGISLINSTVTVEDCIVSDNGTIDSSRYYYTSNSAFSTTGAGIMIGSGNSIINRNIIRDNIGLNYTGGIAVSLWSGSADVTNNLIYRNGAGGKSGYGGGIEVDKGSPKISHNTIIGNYSHGIFTYRYGTPVVEYNNIFDNKGYDFKNYEAYATDINAASNWWGTTEASLIDQHIYDFYDDYYQGKVTCTPIASSPFENTAPTQPGQPTHSDTSANPGYDDDTSLEFSWKASIDDVGIDHYNIYASIDGGDGGAYSLIGTATINSSTLSAVDGHNYSVQVEAIDTSGKIGERSPKSAVIICDTTPSSIQTISSSTHPDENTWYSNNDPAFSWTVSSDLSGIAGYSYELNQEQPSTPNQTIDSTEATASYTDVADGIWYFHVRAKDNAGNWEQTAHYRVMIDTTTPNTIIDVGASGAIYQDNVTFTWHGEDNQTQQKDLEYSYRLSGPGYDNTWSAWTSNTSKTYTNLKNGDYTFQVKSRDKAGHEDNQTPAESSFTIKVVSNTWYFAEGNTMEGFDEFLCIQNPNPTTANVTIDYMPEGVTPLATRNIQVPASSRKTIHVNKYDVNTDPGGAGQGFGGLSCKVESDIPIVAERPMYFNLGAWIGGHNVMGYSVP
jgi:hypothetical protein